MGPLFWAILIMAGISIPLSYVIEIKNALRLFKDAADIGYKLNGEKFKEIPTDKEEAKKLFTQALLIPFYNLFVAYSHIEQYNNTINLQLEQCDTFGILEKMNPVEKEFYEKKPTALTAMIISIGLSKFPTTVTGQAVTGSITDKETNSEIEFAIGKDVKEITIVKATGIYDKMTLEEQRKEVAKTYVNMYDEATRQYGSYENFLKEVENDPSKANLDFYKKENVEKRDYAYEKEKLEAAKQEALRLQEVDNSDKEVEQPKVKKK